ncbi:hypothetical protein VQ056_21720 [Paenibacillus sp. JTLBN-2024]
MELIAVVMLVLLAGGWVVLNRIGGAKYWSVTKLHMEGLRLKRSGSPDAVCCGAIEADVPFPAVFLQNSRSIQKKLNQPALQRRIDAVIRRGNDGLRLAAAYAGLLC